VRSVLARRFSVVVLAAVAVAVAGCQAVTPTASAPATTATTSATIALPTTTVPVTTTQPPPPGHGQVIVLDPGHNGGNAGHPAQINAQVPAGRGQSKACDTTGTATNAGYTEHAFTWDVANRVQADLVAKGYQVIMTRPNDTGVGPCVNVRAAIGNQANAAAAVSIHGDGSLSAGAHGFHVEYASPAVNAAQGAPSIALATALRDSGRTAGFTTANYIGANGLFGRADLAGLNLSTRPKVLIECGNMRNANDAALMSSTTGRQQIADFIAAGIIAYLSH
jgi:N-acetylmuramoyl-L-alanine amidase